MFTAAEYKSTVQDRISFGGNFRKFRYAGTELSLMPNADSLGSGSRDLQEAQGLFFEQWRVWLGVFEKTEHSLPDAAFKLGANWEISEDDGASWFGAFILKPPIRQPQWYECIFARFLAGANLTVSYSVGQDTYSTVEGNRVEDTVPAQFTAIVGQQQRPTDLSLPGTPASSIYLEGYHIEPKVAPAVNKQQKLAATLNGVAGEFIVLPTVQPSAGQNAGTGDVVKGVFLVKGV
ncbi:hypothetical protein N836_09465 [Leptolyngbya sp. Heron Island J]|uniref:hypothetical protein n=1 Tax=Leptolyngbya sp. Heron Island J TaxID=1385935 RepID=UPI0003B9A0C5|nr:hypothetical protein [Leptolyngbya sp. Heron Island J]ESA35937.1 hypothetical protein N836_09465 [Leptolyngbya sp. Heron Island J]